MPYRTRVSTRNSIYQVLVKSRKSRRVRADRTHSRHLFLEPLEDRLLLSTGNLPRFPTSPFYMATESVDMTLRIDEVDGVDTLRLIDTERGDLLAAETVSNISSVVQIVGSADNDILRLDVDSSTIASVLPAGISFEAGGGIDTLAGPRETGSAWHVTGPGAGTLGESDVLVFSDVEYVVGGSGEDTLFGPGTATTWSIAGSKQGLLQDTDASAALVNFSAMEILSGGDSLNTLDYSLFPTDVTADLATGAAEGDIRIVNFDAIVANRHSATPHGR